MSKEEVIGFPSKLFHNSNNSLRELQIGKWSTLICVMLLLTSENCIQNSKLTSGKAKFGPLQDFHFQGLHHLQVES